jgi:hypothetical protein
MPSCLIHTALIGAVKVKIGCHTFRATGITAYLEAGRTLENAQAMVWGEAAALRLNPAKPG